MKRRTLLQGVLALFGMAGAVQAKPCTLITDWPGEPTLSGRMDDSANIIYRDGEEIAVVNANAFKEVSFDVLKEMDRRREAAMCELANHLESIIWSREQFNANV